MQILSNLQRNSTYKIALILLGAIVVPILSSITPIFPILFGVFVICAPIEGALLYLFVLSTLLPTNVFPFMLIILVLYRGLLKDIITHTLTHSLQHLASLVVIYLMWWLWKGGNPLFYAYNFAVDLILITLFIKCELN
ncbi:MAG: hypothetical protein C6I01_06175 [Epsilonproteobacteria bacterium]|nr:hypothetical protein [Campylobacterota bacterium]NPA89000.1 hypothetical protein [Campylobacterota bacterium]